MFKINYNLKGLISIFLFMLMSTLTFGQTENDPSKFVPNIIPPSPTAYGLGTYGNTPVGLFTGSQNINIPIYTYKTANLEVPISMFYSSNGVKVDEISSNVGQSWNLSFGGVITRIVRDKPDEERGEYPIPISMTEEMGRYSPQALEFYQYIGENDVDTEADLFSFNFGKYSGKFVFDNDGGIVLMPAQDFQINCTVSSDGFDFVITTPDGVKYFFNDKEITSQRVVGSGHSIPITTVSSWYLSKIVHPKGDVIQFFYNSEVSNYITSKSQTFRMLSPRIQYDQGGSLEKFSPSLSSVCDHTITLNGKSIKSIKSTNPEYGEVSFTYLSSASADVTSGNRKIEKIIVKDKTAKEIENVGFTYTTTTNKRVFLDKIQFKDINQNYQFEYEDRNNLPQRLSYSQDHWGYFNGKSNLNLVPKGITLYEFSNVNYNGADKEPDSDYAVKGLLKKITYPTKGYTIFDYEANTYYGTKLVYPPKTYKSLNVVTTEQTYSAVKTTSFINPTPQDISLVGGVSFNCLDANLNVGKNQAYISVYDNTTNKYIPLKRSDNESVVSNGNMYTIRPNTEPEAKNLFFTAELNHEYKLTLEADFTCTSSTLNFNYYPTPPVELASNIKTGGIRVAQTLDYSLNKPEPVVKKFLYAKKDDLSKSSGNKGQDPYYIDRFRVDRIMESPVAGIYGVVTSKTLVNLSSSSLVSLFDTGNSNVFYQYVTISYGNNFLNGGEEHEFIVHRDAPDGFVFGNYEVRNAPLSNLGWDNGLLKKIDYFNKELKTIKETINIYEERYEFRKEVRSFSSRKNYEKIASASVNYVCTQADLSKRTKYISCVAVHKHVYSDNLVDNLIKGKSYYTCIAPGNDNKTTFIEHPCYGVQLPKTISNLENIDNLSIVSYKNIGFWYYLKSSQDITYDVSGSNPICNTAIYNYNGINHVQLSSQTKTNSKKETITTKYFNAKDAEMSGKPFAAELAEKNILSPLNTQTFTGNNKLSEQLITYNNLLLPNAVYSAKFPNANSNITGIGNLEKKIVFNQYDDSGNILQYTIEGGVPTAIIWGYNKTQPIAKIENASYSDVQNYVSDLQTKSDTGTEIDLLSNLNSLRNALSNAMVTTYTYLPMIGISTVTDPKGNTTTYSYDEFNRLKTIKDAQGHVVSENRYHFKN